MTNQKYLKYKLKYLNLKKNYLMEINLKNNLEDVINQELFV